MKKMIGTKVKRTIAGQLAFATAMIFSLPGNMLAQQTQTITAPSIDDVTYSTTSFSVAATSSSGLAVKYGVAGPATVNSSGSLTMIGKGSVTLFFFQDGDADYYPAAPVVKSFTINGATATVDLANASAVYDGTGQFLTPIQTDSAGATLNEPITVTYTDAAGDAVASPTNVGVYAATATITSASSYSGSATGTLTITPAVATVTISATSQSYDGAQKPVTVVTVPAGLSVTTTYGGSFVPAAAIEAVAAVAAVAAVEAVAAVLYVEGDVIPEGMAVGDVKTAAVAAVVAAAAVAAVDAVAAVIAPSSAGDYAVTATVVDDNYSGSSSATLTIGSVTIDTTAVTYTGVAQSPSVTLVPSDLTHTVTYTDSAGEAVSGTTNADTYTVTVTVSDVRYPGDISASYTINPAPLTADLGDLSISYALGAPSSEVWAGTLSFSDVAAVEAVAAVLYVEGDTIPEGKAVGDVKTAAVDAVTFSGFVGGESATTEVVAAVAGVAAQKFYTSREIQYQMERRLVM